MPLVNSFAPPDTGAECHFFTLHRHHPRPFPPLFPPSPFGKPPCKPLFIRVSVHIDLDISNPCNSHNPRSLLTIHREGSSLGGSAECFSELPLDSALRPSVDFSRISGPLIQSESRRTRRPAAPFFFPPFLHDRCPTHLKQHPADPSSGAPASPLPFLRSFLSISCGTIPGFFFLVRVATSLKVRHLEFYFCPPPIPSFPYDRVV